MAAGFRNRRRPFTGRSAAYRLLANGRTEDRLDEDTSQFPPAVSGDAAFRPTSQPEGDHQQAAPGTILPGLPGAATPTVTV